MLWSSAKGCLAAFIHYSAIGVSEKRPFWLAYVFFHFVSMILALRFGSFFGFGRQQKGPWDEWPGWCKTRVAFGFDCRIYTVYHTGFVYLLYTYYISISNYFGLCCHVSDPKPRKTPGALGTDFEVLRSNINPALKDEVLYQHVWIILLWSKDCSDVFDFCTTCNKLQPPVATKHELTKVLLILDEATPSSGPATPFTRSVAKKEYQSGRE